MNIHESIGQAYVQSIYQTFTRKHSVNLSNIYNQTFSQSIKHLQPNIQSIYQTFTTKHSVNQTFTNKHSVNLSNIYNQTFSQSIKHLQPNIQSIYQTFTRKQSVNLSNIYKQTFSQYIKHFYRLSNILSFFELVIQSSIIFLFFSHPPGIKETSFMYAISSAGLVHEFARACAQGIMDRCTCDESKHLENTKTWLWGGCGDNIRFGLKFTRKFLRRSRRTEKDIRAQVDEHNSGAGIKVSPTSGSRNVTHNPSQHAHRPKKKYKNKPPTIAQSWKCLTCRYVHWDGLQYP